MIKRTVYFLTTQLLASLENSFSQQNISEQLVLITYLQS